MADRSHNQQFNSPTVFEDSEENPHLSRISFDLDNYLSNLSPGSRNLDRLSPNSRSGPGFLMPLSLDGFVPHDEVILFLSAGKEEFPSPSWTQLRPDNKYLLSFPSSHAGRAFFRNSFPPGRLSVGLGLVPGWFWPTIQSKRASTVPSPHKCKKTKTGFVCDPPGIPASVASFPSSFLPADPSLYRRKYPDTALLPGSLLSAQLPGPGTEEFDISAINELLPSVPVPPTDILSMQLEGIGPKDRSAHFCFSTRPSGGGLRVEVLGSRLPPARATFAYDYGASGGHHEVPRFGRQALLLLTRSNLFEYYLAESPNRPIPEIGRNLACAFAQWFGPSVVVVPPG
jgi:hypothetical protein